MANGEEALCKTCQHSACGACTQTERGLTAGWAAHGGYLPDDKYPRSGIRKCPRFEKRGLKWQTVKHL